MSSGKCGCYGGVDVMKRYDVEGGYRRVYPLARQLSGADYFAISQEAFRIVSRTPKVNIYLRNHSVGGEPVKEKEPSVATNTSFLWAARIGRYPDSEIEVIVNGNGVDEKILREVSEEFSSKLPIKRDTVNIELSE
jgi:hypothetical protein